MNPAAAAAERAPRGSWRWPAALLAASLLWQLPLLLCTPRWSDSHYYDTVAAGVLRGDIVYRDLLLHVAPGMQLLQAGVRWALGWSNLALRAFDAGMLLCLAWLLACLAVPPGRLARRLWLALAVGLFQFGRTEHHHCQPDHWMLTLALAATALRARRWDGRVGLPMLEGMLWASACLIKPFAFVVGAAVVASSWLMGGRGLLRTFLEELRVLAGGLLTVAAAGYWIVKSGNWEAYDQTRNSAWWQLYYLYNAPVWVSAYNLMRKNLPWSAVQLAGALVAAANLAGAWSGGSSRARRGLLAALCLAWLFQANALQAKLEYHLSPGLLLCLGCLWTLLEPRAPGAGRWLAALAAGGLAWGLAPAGATVADQREPGPWLRDLAALPTAYLSVALGSAGAALAWRLAPRLGTAGVATWALAGAFALILPHHALLAPARLRHWAACWRHAEEPWLLDALTTNRHDNLDVGEAALAEVKTFLRNQNVQGREVEGFSVATLPLYVGMGLRSPHRFLIPTVLDVLIPPIGKEMDAEIRAARRRFSVHARNCALDELYARRHGPPDGAVVFRNDRYEVRRIDAPAGGGAP